MVVKDIKETPEGLRWKPREDEKVPQGKDLAACARPQGRHEGVPEWGGTSVIKGESGWHWTST